MNPLVIARYEAIARRQVGYVSSRLPRYARNDKNGELMLRLTAAANRQRKPMVTIAGN